MFLFPRSECLLLVVLRHYFCPGSFEVVIGQETLSLMGELDRVNSVKVSDEVSTGTQ